MELLNNDSIQNYSLEGEVIKGEAMVKNGRIEKCVIKYRFDNFGAEHEFSELEIIDMHKEFSLLLSAIDKQKGVGNVQ